MWTRVEMFLQKIMNNRRANYIATYLYKLQGIIQLCKVKRHQNLKFYSYNTTLQNLQGVIMYVAGKVQILDISKAYLECIKSWNNFLWTTSLNTTKDTYAGARLASAGVMPFYWLWNTEQTKKHDQ